MPQLTYTTTLTCDRSNVPRRYKVVRLSLPELRGEFCLLIRFVLVPAFAALGIYRERNLPVRTEPIRLHQRDVFLIALAYPILPFSPHSVLFLTMKPTTPITEGFSCILTIYVPEIQCPVFPFPYARCNYVEPKCIPRYYCQGRFNRTWAGERATMQGQE